jgi:hypothetical protein|tara:strand:+ start:35911 stop:36087 length:177 start_codon:yes stop_codon:yes gene_type:complete
MMAETRANQPWEWLKLAGRIGSTPVVILYGLSGRKAESSSPEITSKVVEVFKSNKARQ